VQSRAVVIVKAPCPPGDGNDAGLEVTVKSQRFGVAVGAVIDVSVLVQALEITAKHAMASAVRVFISQRITSPGGSPRKSFASSAD